MHAYVNAYTPACISVVYSTLVSSLSAAIVGKDMDGKEDQKLERGNKQQLVKLCTRLKSEVEMEDTNVRIYMQSHLHIKGHTYAHLHTELHID